MISQRRFFHSVAAHLVMIASVFVFGSARAEIKPAGVFIPNQCGAKAYGSESTMALVDIAEVCFGRLTVDAFGRSIPAVELRLTTGQSEVFRVSSRKRVGWSSKQGQGRFLYQLRNDEGMSMALRVVHGDDGQMLSAEGSYGVIPFEVSEFESIFTTQTQPGAPSERK